MLDEPCRVCASQERDKIEIFLSNAGLPGVGCTIWDLEAWELSRHRDEHMHGIALKVNTDPVRVIGHMQDLAAVAMENVRDARAGNECANATSTALRTAMTIQKTLADTTGVTKHMDPTQLMPLWNKMQQAILTALEDFPEARDAVLKKLDQVQADARGLH